MIPQPFRRMALPAAIAVASAAISFGAARADVIHITSDVAAYGYDTAYLNATALTFPGPYGSTSGGVSSVDMESGADLISGTNQTANGSLFSAVVFCTQADAYLVDPPYTFTQGTLSSTIADPTRQAQIAALIGNGTLLLQSGAYAIGGTTYTATEVSSALQIAVWTAEYQTGSSNNGTGGYDAGSATTTGGASSNFWVSGLSNPGDVTLANTFLDYVTGGTWGQIGTVVQLLAQTPTPNQSLSYYVAGTAPTGGTSDPVPEPATTLVFGVGLLGLLAVRRRGVCSKTNG